jgi:uncharacterized protein YkwD
MRWLLAMLMAVAAGPAAADCARAMPAGTEAAIPATGIDQALFAQALTAATNAHRCAARRRDLAATPALQPVAAAHVACMARTRVLTHGGEAGGCPGARDRFAAAGFGGRRASENIARMPRFGGPGRPFRVIDESRCVFAAPDGSRMAGHSYASLAQEAAALFADSDKHRQNLMDRRVSHSWAALALDRSARYCGSWYVAQVFLR